MNKYIFLYIILISTNGFINSNIANGDFFEYFMDLCTMTLVDLLEKLPSGLSAPQRRQCDRSL